MLPSATPRILTSEGMTLCPLAISPTISTCCEVLTRNWANTPSVEIVTLKPLGSTGVIIMDKKLVVKSPLLSIAVRINVLSVSTSIESSHSPKIYRPFNSIQLLSSRAIPLLFSKARERLDVGPSSASVNVVSGIR